MSDIEGGMFGDKEYFKPLVDSISNMKVGNDWFLVANDFASYLDAQVEVDKVRGWKLRMTRHPYCCSLLWTCLQGLCT
jgi:starch phosphorylase